MNKPNLERRRYPRLEKRLVFKIRGDDFDITTETKNISCIGAYCSVNRYIPPMTKLKLILVLPHTNTLKRTGEISCQGVVVRAEQQDDTTENKYNIAIYFNKISSGNLKKIADYVSSQILINA